MINKKHFWENLIAGILFIIDALKEGQKKENFSVNWMDKNFCKVMILL